MSKNRLKIKNVIEEGKLYKVLVKFSFNEKDEVFQQNHVSVIEKGIVSGGALKPIWENRCVQSLKMSDMIQEV